MEKDYIRQLRDTIRVFKREILFQNTASCCNGISLAQCHTLLEIEKKNEISVSELAENLSLDKSTVSRTIEGLVNIDMVDRIIPKENRRLALLTLTKNGEKVCNRINDNNDSFFEEVLKCFTQQEMNDLLRLFTKLTSGMVDSRAEIKQC